jgi:nitroreductase
MLRVALSPHVTLETDADGTVAACFNGHSVSLGKFDASAAGYARDLRRGQPLGSLASEGPDTSKESHRLLRQLARRGLLEYRLRHPRQSKDKHKGKDQVVIEPQMPDYWPRMPPLRNADVIALSRFAYLRRRANEMILESPLAGAVFKICDPQTAAALARLSAPQHIGRLRGHDGFPGIALLALLVDCRILFKIETAPEGGLRRREGDADLVLWDFHDLLFHARSTQGRHANPIGGVYPYLGVLPSPPAVRPPWRGKTRRGKTIDLPKSAAHSHPMPQVATLLRERHSTRIFDASRPITLAELALFLDGAARVQSRFEDRLELDGDQASAVGYAVRPYPSGGGSWELELYLAVAKCEGLGRGFYHYDAGGHALVRIGVPVPQLEAAFMGAASAMGTSAPPQILTLYLLAADLGLGGCAIGTADIDLFARMTGIEFHIEGPVAQFALGRPVDREPAPG